MENTDYNKTLFFSQFMGENVIYHPCDNCNFKLTEVSLIDCEVGLWGDWSGGTHPQLSCNDVIGISDVKLNLGIDYFLDKPFLLKNTSLSEIVKYGWLKI